MQVCFTCSLLSSSSLHTSLQYRISVSTSSPISSLHDSYHSSGISGSDNRRLCSIMQVVNILTTFFTSHAFFSFTFNSWIHGNWFFSKPMQCSDLILALESLSLKNSFWVFRQDWPAFFLYEGTILLDGFNAESPKINSNCWNNSASCKFNNDCHVLNLAILCRNTKHGNGHRKQPRNWLHNHLFVCWSLLLTTQVFLWQKLMCHQLYQHNLVAHMWCKTYGKSSASLPLMATKQLVLQGMKLLLRCTGSRIEHYHN